MTARTSAARKVEYTKRNARAQARGFSGYGAERAAKVKIAQRFKELGTPVPSARTKTGRVDWDKILRQPWAYKTGGKRLVQTRWMEDDVRFVLPGTQWDADSRLVEIREKFMTKEEAIEYIQRLGAQKVLVVEVLGGEEGFQVWLDMESPDKDSGE